MVIERSKTRPTVASDSDSIKIIND